VLAFYLAALETEADRATMESLYTAYWGTAVKAALYVCNFNKNIAEDAASSAFLWIAEHWEKFLLVPRNKWRPYISIIAERDALDIMRKEKKHMPLDNYTDAIRENADLGAILEHKDNQQYIVNCLSRLPEEYQLILELRYFHDLTNPEIAEVIGITANNAAVRIHRAITELRKILADGDM
jgi:RNA polymerase sigma-70 factor (ECF subfamily)